MKTNIRNANDLARFVESTLPLFSITGLAKDLRKIKSDSRAKGKGIIIWWGSSRLQEVIELRVSVALVVRRVNMFDPPVAKECERLLQQAYMAQNGEVMQEKEEIAVHVENLDLALVSA